MADKVERWIIYDPAPEAVLCTITNEDGEYIVPDVARDDALVIVAFHNNAILINPSNPMAVAERIADLIRSAKPLIDELESYGSDKPCAFDRFKSDLAAITKPAIGDKED